MVSCPNDSWSVDFKGWWKDREGLRVEPLTVRDEHSRMLLEMRALDSSRTEDVRACFERLFERHGLPGAIRSDNGSPFASSNGLLGLSRLSAWWVALGIGLERSRPGCPQDNGAHERMHLDIRRELQAGRIGREQERERGAERHALGHEGLEQRVAERTFELSQLNKALNQVLNDKEIIKRIEDHGADVEGSTPEQFGALVKAELVKWKAVVQRAKLSAD